MSPPLNDERQREALLAAVLESTNGLSLSRFPFGNPAAALGRALGAASLYKFHICYDRQERLFILCIGNVGFELTAMKLSFEIRQLNAWFMKTQQNINSQSSIPYKSGTVTQHNQLHYM